MKYSALALVLTATFTTSVFAHGLTPAQKTAVENFCEVESKYSYHHPFKTFCDQFKVHGDSYAAADVAGAVSGDFNDYVSSRDAAATLIKDLGMDSSFTLKNCN